MVSLLDNQNTIVNDVNPIVYSGSPTYGISDPWEALIDMLEKGDTLNKIIKSTFNQHPLKMKEISGSNH
ncbi:MAG: hypothetical protein CM15mP58_21890 [Burkholderiaceae bacterium]|nr:MAG: hypothetical protein CM15mP58_21890 [Burkholderiaceae bacterium]